MERAEIYFLDAARAMVESGDWLVPRYQGQAFFDKPPLAYWAMALSFLWLGASTGAARLVAVLAALGAVAATLWLGRLLFDRRSALAGGLVLATTLAFLSLARLAMSDMLLALFTTISVALAVRAFRPDPPGWTAPALGLALGLGFLAKGPIALLVPGLAVVVLLAQRRRRPTIHLPGATLGVLAFVLVALVWFALVHRRMGAGPLAYFFLRENLERFVGEAYDVGRPIWFYLPAYVVGGLPWSVFLPLALVRLLRDGDRSVRDATRFLAIWVALVLIPLSLSRGKIDYYLLPLYPAVSLLIGRYLAGTPWRRLDRAWVRVSLVAGAAGLAVLAARLPPAPEEWLPSPSVRAFLLVTVALIALAFLAVAVKPAPVRLVATLAAGVAAVSLELAAFFLPAFVAAQPNRRIVEDVGRERVYRPDLALALCSDPPRARRDVLFHVRLAAVERCDLWPLAASERPYLFLLRPAEDASFRGIPAYRHIATYRTLPASALTFPGLLRLPPPQDMVLGANFATTDPVALRKKNKEYRQEIHRGWEEAARAARRR